MIKVKDFMTRKIKTITQQTTIREIAHIFLSFQVGFLPVVDEEMVQFLKIKDEEIFTEIIDYSVQRRNKPSYGKINYKQLRSGCIKINGKDVQTGSISSYYKAREISNVLKEWIMSGNFYLTSSVTSLPLEEDLNSLDILSKEEL